MGSTTAPVGDRGPLPSRRICCCSCCDRVGVSVANEKTGDEEEARAGPLEASFVPHVLQRFPDRVPWNEFDGSAISTVSSGILSSLSSILSGIAQPDRTELRTRSVVGSCIVRYRIPVWVRLENP